MGVIDELGWRQCRPPVGDAGFAGTRGEQRVKRGVPARLVPPARRSASLGENGSEPQLATWKCSLRLAMCSFVAGRCFDGERIAVRRIDREIWAG